MFKSTTILSVRRDNEVVIAGDGQVTLNDAIVKHGSNKVQKIEKIENKKVKYQVLVGFAGAAADAMSLFEKLEGKLDEHKGDLRRAAVELAKDWRSDRVLRRLDAMLVAADAKSSFLISGNGDLIAPDDGILAIGTGGTMALAAARALLKNTELSASDIVKEAMDITSDICIYTNKHVTVEVLKIS